MSTPQIIQDQPWLAPLAQAAHTAVDGAYKLLPDDGAAISDALHGTWLGHPLHPALTDVPIGAWSVAAALDLLESFGDTRFAAGADAAVAIGVVGALASVATGWNDWHRIGTRDMGLGGRGRRSREAITVGLVHGILNEAGLFLQIGSLIARRRGKRGLGRVLSFTGFGVSSVAAYLGGQLVYDSGVGVRE